MKRTIKFKRVYQYEETGVISMIAWGNIDHKDVPNTDFSCFKSPSQVHRSYPIADVQFTGLTDKNGKEIYEGDVCLCENYFNAYVDNRLNDLKGTVRLKNGCFWIIDESDLEDVKEIPLFLFDKDLSEEDKIEVIGNMFQNT